MSGSGHPRRDGAGGVRGAGQPESGGVLIVRMWEVRSYPERLPDLLSWVCEQAVPTVETHPLHIASEVFSSTDHRVVVISKWRSAPVDLPPPPGHLVARQPHSWDFTPVDR